jgi:hypothetical protein
MLFRRLVALLAFCCMSASSRAVFAASVGMINDYNVTRTVPLRTDPTSRLMISRSDCLAGDVLSFAITVADYAGTNFEVWAGEGTGDCRDQLARTGTNPTCWRVFQGTPASNTPTIPIRVQDIAAKKIPDSTNAGTDADCTSKTGGSAPEGITLWFLFIQSLTNQGGASWATKLDLLGPNPPIGISLGVESTALKVSWAQNTDPDVNGYYLYCDPPPGTPSSTSTVFDAGSGNTSGGASEASCPDATAVASPDDASDDAADAEDAGATEACVPTTTTPAAEGGTSGGICNTSHFTPNQPPDLGIAAYKCGEAGKSETGTTIGNLTNGVSTTVTIAAIDAVLNVGPLSGVQCETPQFVNGFDEIYRQAGGTAGGGFCSLSAQPRRRGGGAFLGVFLAVLVTWGGRRRSRPASN